MTFCPITFSPNIFYGPAEHLVLRVHAERVRDRDDNSDHRGSHWLLRGPPPLRVRGPRLLRDRVRRGVRRHTARDRADRWPPPGLDPRRTGHSRARPTRHQPGHADWHSPRVRPGAGPALHQPLQGVRDRGHLHPVRRDTRHQHQRGPPHARRRRRRSWSRSDSSTGRCSSRRWTKTSQRRRGCRCSSSGTAFMLVVAVAVSFAVQVTGVLLIFSLMVTPAATAQYLSRRPCRAIVISVASL